MRESCTLARLDILASVPLMQVHPFDNSSSIFLFAVLFHGYLDCQVHGLGICRRTNVRPSTHLNMPMQNVSIPQCIITCRLNEQTG